MKTYKLILALALTVSVLAGCKPEIKGELGTPSDKVAGMGGTWQLVSFRQQDPNNPVLEERDMSQFYIVEGVTPMQLTLDVATRTYSVAITQGRNFFGDAGTWALDDEVAPSMITLMNSTDTITMNLGNMVMPSTNSFGLEYHRVCSSDQFKNVIYKFNFTRL